MSSTILATHMNTYVGYFILLYVAYTHIQSLTYLYLGSY